MCKYFQFTEFEYREQKTRLIIIYFINRPYFDTFTVFFIQFM